MKKINKISIFLFLILGITFISCETTDLELLDNPNDVTIEKANLDRFLVAIQNDYKSFMHQMGDNGSSLTRIEYMFGLTYINNYDATSTNTEWGLAYQSIFSNIKGAEILATEIEGNKHLGVMNVLKASILLTLVDFYGDVPYSEATNPAEFPFPNLDDGASVYAAALGLLDEGISQLGQDGPNLGNDFFYDNDFSKWRKLANTLKMTAYLNTRLVDSDAANKFNAIVNSGNYISSSADDFQWRYSSDARNPYYTADYNVSGAGNYRSNWLMEQLVENNDPRKRYYFYRQVPCTPGNVDANGVMCPASPTALFCSTQSRPSHYPASMTFCTVAEGYWGRDHANAEGIPPDSFKRTAIGVYPAAGRFDSDEFDFVGIDQGGQGAGITPIMLASWVDLMRAEFALAGNNPAAANTLLQSALSKSIAKVKPFASLDPTADLSFEPSQGEINTFIANIGSAFSAADTNGKWDILAIQQFIAHYGNGIESYNFYRRTGYPTSLQFDIDPSFGGPFVRSFLYSANEANTNNNVTQKTDQTVQVFWDNNPGSPGFPFAN
jgi:hypothetical protein